MQQLDIIYNFRRKRFVRESQQEQEKNSTNAKATQDIQPDPNDNLTTFYNTLLAEETEKRKKLRTISLDNKQSAKIESVQTNSTDDPEYEFNEEGEDDETVLSKQQQHYCEICKQTYSDLTEQHKRSSIHLFNLNLQFELPKPFGIPTNSKGYQLLRDAFHWNEKTGLGKAEQGRLFPIPTLVKRNRLGLGNPAEKEHNLPLEFVVKQQQQQQQQQQTRRKLRLTKARKRRIEEKQKEKEKRIRILIYGNNSFTPEQQQLLS